MIADASEDPQIICHGCGLDLSDLKRPFYMVTHTHKFCDESGAVMTELKSEPLAYCEKCHFEGRSAP